MARSVNVCHCCSLAQGGAVSCHVGTDHSESSSVQGIGSHAITRGQLGSLAPANAESVIAIICRCMPRKSMPEPGSSSNRGAAQPSLVSASRSSVDSLYQLSLLRTKCHRWLVHPVTFVSEHHFHRDRKIWVAHFRDPISARGNRTPTVGRCRAGNDLFSSPIVPQKRVILV